MLPKYMVLNLAYVAPDNYHAYCEYRLRRVIRNASYYDTIQEFVIMPLYASSSRTLRLSQLPLPTLVLPSLYSYYEGVFWIWHTHSNVSKIYVERFILTLSAFSSINMAYRAYSINISFNPYLVSMIDLSEGTEIRIDRLELFIRWDSYGGLIVIKFVLIILIATLSIILALLFSLLRELFVNVR